MTETRKTPSLTGSIDFAKFHELDAKGEDPKEALEAATVRVEPPAPLEELKKTELLEVAAEEGVEVKPGTRKEKIVEAIETHRTGDAAE